MVLFVIYLIVLTLYLIFFLSSLSFCLYIIAFNYLNEENKRFPNFIFLSIFLSKSPYGLVVLQTPHFIAPNTYLTPHQLQRNKVKPNTTKQSP
jgi:hypothetical protein